MTDTTYDAKPTTRCCFNYFCKLRHVDYARPYFHAYITEQGRNEGTLTVAQWDSLLALYEHQREAEDAQDEAETVLDARYA